MAEGVHRITAAFEAAICQYTGAPYCVAVDNCSNALFLALMYSDVKGRVITIPQHTYPSVPCEILHAGGIVEFSKSHPLLKGAYQLRGTGIFDSALRFTANMYIPYSLMCLSFTGPYKHLKLGKGGAILTDDKTAYEWFKRARFSGRRECSYHEDKFDALGWNFYMDPMTAARGLQLMDGFYSFGKAKKMPDIELPYPDLSKWPIYGGNDGRQSEGMERAI
jgi:dTDP-4-amino-4,6-dideoxygalactose transaminase